MHLKYTWRVFAPAFFLLLWLVPAEAQESGQEWRSRVIPEARGESVVDRDGSRRQIRYPGWDQTDFSSYPGYGYSDKTIPVAAKRAPSYRALAPNASKGRAIWERSACINCHYVSGDKRWAGNIGPSLDAYGLSGKSFEYTFQAIYDPRIANPASFMPPWGSASLLKIDEIADLAAYLHSLKSPVVNDARRLADPTQRPLPQNYFGDNLDEATNPSLVETENADSDWSLPGPGGKSCASCHGAQLIDGMKAVATRYPSYS